MDKTKICIKYLGHPGKLLSWSKSGYRNQYPDNIVCFNGNICTETDKIWYGDIDVNRFKTQLCEISKELNESIFILYEMDGRFENENYPKIENHLVKITPEGIVTAGDRYKDYIDVTNI